jgi:uncharacterized protein (DUF1330 family)
MAIDPRAMDIKRFLKDDPGGPVVMLNLLRFRPDGGRERYREYVTAFAPFLEKYGATVVYVGDGQGPVVAEDGQAWDAVLLVRYPSRRAFSRMVGDMEYQKITHLRTEALAEAVLQPTVAWDDRTGEE